MKKEEEELCKFVSYNLNSIIIKSLLYFDAQYDVKKYKYQHYIQNYTNI